MGIGEMKVEELSLQIEFILIAYCNPWIYSFYTRMIIGGRKFYSLREFGIRKYL